MILKNKGILYSATLKGEFRLFCAAAV